MINFFRKIGQAIKTRNEIPKLNPQEFLNGFKTDKRSIIIDVRTPTELSQGQIKGSRNINFTSPEFPSKIEKLDKTKSYYLYCRSGMRSLNACVEMKNIGIEKVFNLKGGFLAWKKYNSSM